MNGFINNIVRASISVICVFGCDREKRNATGDFNLLFVELRVIGDKYRFLNTRYALVNITR